ncbi:hypothetical protein PABG_12019 [Paracoccidioides brasiliensis Pb03]|nr:hypothetical protein PABG_12019 [Paracoccidioides brasiliensis Pb03]
MPLRDSHEEWTWRDVGQVGELVDGGFCSQTVGLQVLNVEELVCYAICPLIRHAVIIAQMITDGSGTIYGGRVVRDIYLTCLRAFEKGLNQGYAVMLHRSMATVIVRREIK